MALYTKEQFIKHTGIESKHWSTYILRPAKGQNGIAFKDGFVDGDDPVNAKFIETCKRNKEKRERELKNLPQVESQETKSVATTEKPDKIRKTETSKNDPEQPLTNLQLKNSKLQEEIELLKAKKEKIYELVIPREHASFLIKNYSEGTKSVWLTATERFLTQVGTELGLSREQIIEHKKYITEIMNDAVRAGVDNANARIKRIAADFSIRTGK